MKGSAHTQYSHGHTFTYIQMCPFNTVLSGREKRLPWYSPSMKDEKSYCLETQFSVLDYPSNPCFSTHTPRFCTQPLYSTRLHTAITVKSRHAEKPCGRSWT